MYVIQNAKITKELELDGRSCVEVEVEPARMGDSSLLLYITGGADGSLELHRIIRNHHDLTLDWYNDNANTAFEDATEIAFENRVDVLAEQEKEQFMQSLLSYGSMNQDLQNRLLSHK
ncbi:hypothetical protein QPK24_19340 [Paenibacillus polygoni]|uniref:IDEAL domain-containing protein n=1 Tax=Paenibacillus polygoni TaxID=3050112 RepID=A0ABY8X2L9_9BACL|nr:hypothetical protein [Paenibacillus polygoni]WIV18503.1 hypothetical protein QPK24_19340 [Paenibacillus polygoni]